MRRFEIFTDSSCDLTQEIIEQFDLHVMQLEVVIDDNPPVLNNQLDLMSFYDQLKAGANAKTSAVTPGHFQEEMKKSLTKGNDILYIGFSSGLSATYNNGVMIMKELQQEFPNRKIYHLDTLCASAGQGLLVYHAAMLREAGAGIEEVQDKIEKIKQHIHHQITVDDLFFLKRGGRIDATTAVVGSVLKIKPIIVMDEEGHLANVGKVRGRKLAIKELFTRMKANAHLDELEYVFISHSACIEEAETLAEMIKNEWSKAQIIISDMGPVIGAHTGPGALALCYLGKTTKGKVGI